MTKNIKTGKFKLPSNLSFRRSIDVSEGLLSSVTPGTGLLKPVHVVQVTVRGAMGNNTAGYDDKGNPLTSDVLLKAQNPTKPNIQTIDRASLDPHCDEMDLSFALGFHNGGNTPDACSRNNHNYQESFHKFIESARKAGLYEQLAERYLWNVVNGRVLWRNGCGILGTATLVTDEGVYRFDSQKLRNRDKFPGIDIIQDACLDNAGKARQLTESLASALKGDSRFFAMDVSLRVRLYKGAEVWPSQEFVEDTQKKRNGRDISRILASRKVYVEGESIRQGVMHSQKIGNAIRTIDEWHGVEGYGAIPVEAFGWKQNEMAALRAPDNNGALDAYRALERVSSTAESLAKGDENVLPLALYTLAVVIRGGVYGVADKEKKDASNQEPRTEIDDDE